MARHGTSPWAGILAGSLAIFLLRSFRFLALMGIFLALGIWYAEGRLEPPSHDLAHFVVSGQEYIISGRVATAPEKAWGQEVFVLEAWILHRPKKDLPVSGKVLVRLRGEKDLMPGDIIRARLRLRRPRNFNNPGAFDYRGYLAARGIFSLATVSSPLLLRKIGHRWDLTTAIEAWRLKIARQIDSSDLSPEVSSLIKALVVGQRRGISSEIREAFVRSGAAHLLAISGLHMGLLATFVGGGFLFLVRGSTFLVHRFNIKKLSLFGALLAIIIYTGLSGGSIPARRAAIMIAVFIFGFWTDRRPPWPALILVAAWIILLIEPLAISQPSFLLSFAAVSGLALFEKRLKTWSSGLKAHVGGIFLVCVVAWLATAPFVFYFFGRLPLLAPISNLVLVPLVGWGLVPLALIFSLRPGVFFLSDILEALCQLVLKTVDLFSHLPNLIFPLNEIGLIGGLFLVGGLLGFFCWRHKALVLVLPGVLLLALSWDLARPPLLRIVIFDVGQGSSCLLSTPQGNLLIDGGGPFSPGFDPGRLVIAPALYKLGIRKLSAVILTHPEADHLAGLPYIVKAFSVGQFIKTEDKNQSRIYQRLMANIEEKRIPLRIVKNKTRLHLGAVEIDLLPPPQTLSGSTNRRSLVIRVTFGRCSFLFPGDIDSLREKMLSLEEIRSDFILIPHHGSKSSSSPDFVKAARPRVAVVSVSAYNRFGLPREEILERYRLQGAQVWRTDRHGAVIIYSDGYSLGVTSWLEGGRDGTILRSFRTWCRRWCPWLWPEPGRGLCQCGQGHVLSDGGKL